MPRSHARAWIGRAALLLSCSLVGACVERSTAAETQLDAHTQTSEAGESENESESESASESEGASEDGETNPDLPAEEMCQPGDPNFIDFELVGTGSDALALDLACTFSAQVQDGETDEYLLNDCSSLTEGPNFPTLRLRVTLEPRVTPLLDPGATMRLRYLREPGEAESFALTVQPGGLLLLLGHGGRGEGFAPEFFTIEREDRNCVSTLPDCATPLEQRLRVALGDTDLALAAGESGELGTEVRFQLNLAQAQRTPGPEEACPQPSESSSRYLIALLPEA